MEPKPVTVNIIIKNATREQRDALRKSGIFDPAQIVIEYDGDGYPSQVRADKLKNFPRKPEE